MEPSTTTRTTIRDWLVSLRTPVAFYPAILLGVQILLAIALTWAARGTLDPAAADTRLFAVDPKAITRLQIEGANETVTLTRGAKGWLIADLAEFPAEGTKVSQLLDKFAGLKRPLPVATSAEAQKRHKVADTGFERKVTLMDGDKAVATLFLGDSPGFKRQFARPAGDGAVYDLDLPLFEVSNRRDDWLSRDTLRLDQDKIIGIAAGDWRLTKGKDGWQLAETTDKPDAAAVTNLLGRIGNLGYRGVLGAQDKPEYHLATPALDLSVQLADGTSRTYRIAQAKDSKDYVLKATDRPWYYKLAEFDLEGLRDLTRDKLLGKAPTAAPAAAPAPAPGPAAGGQAPAADAAAGEPVPTDPGAQGADAALDDQAPPDAGAEGEAEPTEEQDDGADQENADPAAEDQAPPPAGPAAN